MHQKIGHLPCFLSKQSVWSSKFSYQLSKWGKNTILLLLSDTSLTYAYPTNHQITCSSSHESILYVYNYNWEVNRKIYHVLTVIGIKSLPRRILTPSIRRHYFVSVTFKWAATKNELNYFCYRWKKKYFGNGLRAFKWNRIMYVFQESNSYS